MVLEPSHSRSLHIKSNLATEEASADLAIFSKSQTDREGLHLQNSDHPTISLVYAQLGNNYLSWSQAVTTALGAKMKFGLINGKCSKPDEDAEEFEHGCANHSQFRERLLNQQLPTLSLSSSGGRD
ncbi:hypothetical protein Sango_0689900 [Sesamum angolense]|uniref:Retrotransposon Copia-like N-terminal domain-containing protein n=1 Tax=Sesamum angolense TaxID=2727404 RepID=A0AAE2C2N9_9LAMI|nr:hypothetical protein Sango_0689900 [Sesamum angolense]